MFIVLVYLDARDLYKTLGVCRSIVSGVYRLLFRLQSGPSRSWVFQKMQIGVLGLTVEAIEGSSPQPFP